jgi:hypothetical protein
MVIGCHSYDCRESNIVRSSHNQERAIGDASLDHRNDAYVHIAPIWVDCALAIIQKPTNTLANQPINWLTFFSDGCEIVNSRNDCIVERINRYRINCPILFLRRKGIPEQRRGFRPHPAVA